MTTWWSSSSLARSWTVREICWLVFVIFWQTDKSSESSIFVVVINQRIICRRAFGLLKTHFSSGSRVFFVFLYSKLSFFFYFISPLSSFLLLPCLSALSPPSLRLFSIISLLFHLLLSPPFHLLSPSLSPLLNLSSPSSLSLWSCWLSWMAGWYKVLYQLNQQHLSLKWVGGWRGLGGSLRTLWSSSISTLSTAVFTVNTTAVLLSWGLICCLSLVLSVVHLSSVYLMILFIDFVCKSEIIGVLLVTGHESCVLQLCDVEMLKTIRLSYAFPHLFSL